MRWFLSITLLALLALFAACSSEEAQPSVTAPAADAQTIVVYKSPT